MHPDRWKEKTTGVLRLTTYVYYVYVTYVPDLDIHLEIFHSEVFGRGEN